MLIRLEDFRQKLTEDASLRSGCIVDTNILFAASSELDPFNDWAEKVFCELNSMNIPAFTNINIRSEFIDISRRVLIAEALLDFYEVWSDQLVPKVEHSLKSLRTRMDTATKENRTLKLSDIDIKRYKALLNDHAEGQHSMTWGSFCDVHFRPYIKVAWDSIIDQAKIRFLGTRAIESKEYFVDDPKWSDMVDIVGRTGIGTSDAMIINLFLQSKLSLIITADSDVRDVVVSMMPKNKYVLAPDR